MKTRAPRIPPSASQQDEAVRLTTDLVEQYGYVARAYAQGRLSECLYECDPEGIALWESVSRKLDILAERAPDLLSIATYVSSGTKTLAKPKKAGKNARDEGGFQPRIA